MFFVYKSAIAHMNSQDLDQWHKFKSRQNPRRDEGGSQVIWLITEEDLAIGVGAEEWTLSIQCSKPWEVTHGSIDSSKSCIVCIAKWTYLVWNRKERMELGESKSWDTGKTKKQIIFCRDLMHLTVTLVPKQWQVL